MTMWELLSKGEVPFVDDPRIKGTESQRQQKLEDAIITNADFRPERPERCNDGLWELMWDCWAYDPATRPDFATVAGRLRVILDGM